MPFQPASPGSLLAFGVVLIGVVAAFLTGTFQAHRLEPGGGGRVLRRTAVILAVWLGLLSVLVLSDLMPALPLAGLPFFFGAVLVSGLAVGLSPFGGKLAAGVPIAALVGFQAFRLPLELVLHTWSQQGTVPETMTWSGQNWDIVSGILALAVLPWVGRHKSLAWVANLVGFALLLNVVRVALLSSPVPFGWGTNPPLVLALHWPYALIGPVCVAGALAGHLVLTRALLRANAA